MKRQLNRVRVIAPPQHLAMQTLLGCLRDAERALRELRDILYKLEGREVSKWPLYKRAERAECRLLSLAEMLDEKAPF